MALYDNDWNPIDDFDRELGYVDRVEREVYHQYVIHYPGKYHEEIVAEYPETGGKDVRVVCDEEPRGSWETYDSATGKLVEGFDNQYLIDNGYPTDLVHTDTEIADMYFPYTDEQLEQVRVEIEQEEKDLANKQENDQLLDDMPELLCSMYEENLQLKDTIDQQEEVLCAMYESMIGGE